jgi:hypothetical protein
MTQLGNGLSAAEQYADALSVQEAELSTLRRIGVTDGAILGVQGNLANTYRALGRFEEALQMRRDVYFELLRLYGVESEETLREAGNYANLLNQVKRFGEVKTLMRKILPVARRVLSESNELTLKMRWNCAMALYRDDRATPDDFREAVTTLEETTQAARRVLGGAHPVVASIENSLRNARALLAAREGDDVSAVRATLDAMKVT